MCEWRPGIVASSGTRSLRSSTSSLGRRARANTCPKTHTVHIVVGRHLAGGHTRIHVLKTFSAQYYREGLCIVMTIRISFKYTTEQDLVDGMTMTLNSKQQP